MATHTIPDGTTLVDARLGQAYASIAPGDIVYLQNSRSLPVTFRGMNGASGNPVIVRPTGGKVTMGDAGFSYEAVILFRDCEYVWLDGSVIGGETYGFQLNDGYRGIWVGYGSSFIEINNVSITGATSPPGSGIGIHAFTMNGSDGHYRASGDIQDEITIHDCYIEDCYIDGMYLGDPNYANLRLENLTVYDNHTYNCGTSGIKVRGVTTARIYGNLVEECSRRGSVGFREGINIGPDAYDVEVYGNFVKNQQHTGIYVRNPSSGEGPIKIFNNIVYNFGDVYTSDAYGIFADNDYGDMEIYYNTVVDGTGYSVAIAAKVENAEVTNNILSGASAGGVLDLGSGTVKAGNITSSPASLYFVNYAGLDFHLTSSSPARNAAVATGTQPTDDYDGDSRPYGATRDVGADEFIGTAAVSYLFDLDMEEGDLSDFSATATNGGDFSAQPAAAMGGSNYGGEFVVDDGTARWGRYDIGADKQRLRHGFWWDPNGFTVNEVMTICKTYIDSTVGGYRWRLRLEYNSGYVFRSLYIPDGPGAEQLSAQSSVITDAPHWIEIDQFYADPGSNNGFFRVWVDDSLILEQTGIDNDTFYARSLWWGVPLGAGTNVGTFYIDEILANDTGDFIGAAQARGLLGRGVLRGVLEGVLRGAA